MTVGYLGLSRHSLTFRDLRLLGHCGRSETAEEAIGAFDFTVRFPES